MLARLSGMALFEMSLDVKSSLDAHVYMAGMSTHGKGCFSRSLERIVSLSAVEALLVL